MKPEDTIEAVPRRLSAELTLYASYPKVSGIPVLFCRDDRILPCGSGTLTLSYYNIATIVYPETGEELSIADAVARAKPEILVITLGVNGVSFMDEAWFTRDYTALVQMVQAASPNTKIILNSIYPVAAS